MLELRRQVSAGHKMKKLMYNCASAVKRGLSEIDFALYLNWRWSTSCSAKDFDGV